MNIIWKKQDKSIAITSLTDAYIAQLYAAAIADGIITKEEEFDIQTACKDRAKTLVDQGTINKDWKAVAFNITLSDELKKTEKLYFDAWVWDSKKKSIVIDQAKAAEVTKEILRYIRESKLKALDSKFMIALEEGSDTSAIVAEKKYLRNITDLVTPEMSVDDMIKFIEDFKKR